MAHRGNTRRSKSRKRGGRTLFEKRDFKGNQNNKIPSSNVEETSSTLLSNNTDDIPPCSLNNSGDTSTLSAGARKLRISSIDEASTLENKDEDRNESPDDESYYILIGTDIFRTINSCIGICPQEHGY